MKSCGKRIAGKDWPTLEVRPSRAFRFRRKDTTGRSSRAAIERCKGWQRRMYTLHASLQLAADYYCTVRFRSRALTFVSNRASDAYDSVLAPETGNIVLNRQCCNNHAEAGATHGDIVTALQNRCQADLFWGIMAPRGHAMWPTPVSGGSPNGESSNLDTHDSIPRVCTPAVWESGGL